jgi:hypothetical protein
MDGGGTGHGPHDVYPDGWHIKARRLSADGSYDPQGEVIEFYQSGAFRCKVPEVQVVGYLERSFVPTLSSKVEIGDVIQSERFQYGERDSRERITVGRCYDERDPVTHEPTGNLIPAGDHIDESRTTAKFVVEWTGMDGGGTGHGPHDVYPDGWHVKARRLADDGSYDPRGEVIEFYQSGCFNCMVEEVSVVGRMRQSFF